MKTFLQLAEQASRHRRKKLMREADGDVAPKEAEPAKAQADQQMANNQGDRQTAQPEMSDADIVAGLQTAWDKFIKDNNAALTKLKEIQAAQNLATQLNNMPGEIKKVVAALQQQDKAGQKPQMTKPAAKPATPPTTPATPATPPATSATPPAPQ